ncbi:uncharacterized protein [Linepithema humile]|uniref:uncharacterized protein n=1 Tax=Linepithema humile TaxID=83485 RepID=UPI00351E41F8
MSSSRPRRPSVSICDYPEHLNPFNDGTTNSQSQVNHESKSSKELKHKFWTFGRSRKKRSNSFSIKSTWNGLFGKRKEPCEGVEKKSTITTVSTTYKREPYNKPIAPPRLSKDQQEFDEALGTLTRRRKYTFDNTSRYSSNLTVNGDSTKIYDANPQDTTTSIMGVDLTPKPPARRFGQVSPRLKDNIPPLDFEDRQPKENGDVTLRNKSEETPVPPLRRFGNRSSQRLNGITSDLEEDPTNRSGDISLKDENENVPEDYIFKRFSQDAVRKSNLSINSCTSITSAASTYGRKKRRAPQPPKRKEQLEIPLEGGCRPAEPTSEKSIIELQITEPIARAAENIEEVTKKSYGESNENSPQKEQKQVELSTENVLSNDSVVKNETCENSQCVSDMKEKEDSSVEKVTCNPDEKLGRITSEAKDDKEKESNKEQLNNAENSTENFVNVEYERMSQEKIEILKDADLECDEVNLRIKGSALSRSDSFSVKEEIEKIERQIKELESKEASMDHDDHDDTVTNTRLSIQANRRHFFENMVDGPSGPIKLEFKQLPREQTDIHVVRLTDLPVAMPRDPVKVIELHISEPIRHKPELLDEVNPIPKPRRHSALSLKDESETRHLKDEGSSSENHDKRGKSF